MLWQRVPACSFPYNWKADLIGKGLSIFILWYLTRIMLRQSCLEESISGGDNIKADKQIRPNRAIQLDVRADCTQNSATQFFLTKPNCPEYICRSWGPEKYASHNNSITQKSWGGGLVISHWKCVLRNWEKSLETFSNTAALWIYRESWPFAYLQSKVSVLYHEAFAVASVNLSSANSRQRTAMAWAVLDPAPFDIHYKS